MSIGKTSFLVPESQFAVGGSLDILIEDNLPITLGSDTTCPRILHAAYRTFDGGLHRAVLESPVAVGAERAIFQYKVVGIAERLLAGDVTVHQPKIMRMPAQVFAVEFGIVDCHIFHLPEGVFRSDPGIAQLYIFHILENVFAIAFQAVDADIAAEHERISSSMQFQIPDIQILATPEHLIGIVHLHVLNFDVVHLAEHLGSIDTRVCHFQITGVPQCRTPADIEKTTVDNETVHVPEGIISLEPAIDGFDIAALLDGRLSGTDDYILQT